MLFNIISIAGFVISMLLTRYMNQSSNGKKLLKAMAALLLVLKLIEFVTKNLQGTFYYPMEISAISYYLFSIVVLFNIKRFYHLAAFFGIISGIGFYLYYSTLGFMSFLYITDMSRHVIATLCHGILLVGGLYLLKQYDFSKTNRLEILLTMAMIIAHGSLFYVDRIKGDTFIYFLVNPEFLEFSSNLYINHFVKLLYYYLWCAVFVFSVNKFYDYSNLLHREKMNLVKHKKLSRNYH